MKKIRLNVANLDATEILSRDQLKSIFGGSGSGSGSNCAWYKCYCKNSSSPVLLDTSKIIQAANAVEALKDMDCSYLYQDKGCAFDKAC